MAIIAASLSDKFQKSFPGGEVTDVFLETALQITLVSKEKPTSGLRNLIDDPVILELTQEEKSLKDLLSLSRFQGSQQGKGPL